MVFHLAICELFNDKIHGYDEMSDPNILGHYLVMEKLDYAEEEFDEYVEDVLYVQNMKYDIFHNSHHFHVYKHPIIRNYKHIISREEYLKIDIVECHYLSGGECVAVLKTFWLKIIQRKWKKIYQLRQICMQKRRKIDNLRYRELHGRWPYECILPPFLLKS